MAREPNMGPAKTAAFVHPPDRLIANPKARLRDQFREVCRFKHFSTRTEAAYWGLDSPVPDFPQARRSLAWPVSFCRTSGRMPAFASALVNVWRSE